MLRTVVSVYEDVLMEKAKLESMNTLKNEEALRA